MKGEKRNRNSNELISCITKTDWLTKIKKAKLHVTHEIIKCFGKTKPQGQFTGEFYKTCEEEGATSISTTLQKRRQREHF